MRIGWSERALGDLEELVERAPRAARHVYESVVWLVAQPFPRMYRRIEGRRNDHALVVSPYVVLYRVDGDTLTVLRILDGRRRPEPA